MTDSTFRDLVKADWAANPKNPRIRLLLIGFRIAARARNDRENPPRVTAVLPGVAYRLFAEWFLGIEIPWRTRVGPGLRLMHAYGLVIHDDAVIGSNVTIRHGVTIGKAKDGGVPPIIGDGVDIGAHAILIGQIVVGDGATVGAGAVVTKDVAAGTTVVGNPARPLKQE